jgi:hypothetical protein
LAFASPLSCAAIDDRGLAREGLGLIVDAADFEVGTTRPYFSREYMEAKRRSKRGASSSPPSVRPSTLLRASREFSHRGARERGLAGTERRSSHLE